MNYGRNVITGLTLFVISACQSTAPQPYVAPTEPLPEIDAKFKDCVVPIVRVAPKYDLDAARSGVQGWVQLSFYINSDGSTQDIEVLNASPADTFNDEAINALKKWKYQPNKCEVDRAGPISIQLDFKLQ